MCHLTDEDTEVQRGHVTCWRRPGWREAELGWERRPESSPGHPLQRLLPAVKEQMGWAGPDQSAQLCCRITEGATDSSLGHRRGLGEAVPLTGTGRPGSEAVGGLPPRSSLCSSLLCQLEAVGLWGCCEAQVRYSTRK